MMSHGAKVLMVLPLALLLTISKVPVSLSGESSLYFFLLSCYWCIQALSMTNVFLVNYRRTVVSIPNGPSALAVKEAAWGLARYAAISQVTSNYYYYFINY